MSGYGKYQKMASDALRRYAAGFGDVVEDEVARKMKMLESAEALYAQQAEAIATLKAEVEQTKAVAASRPLYDAECGRLCQCITTIEKLAKGTWSVEIDDEGNASVVASPFHAKVKQMVSTVRSPSAAYGLTTTGKPRMRKAPESRRPNRDAETYVKDEHRVYEAIGAGYVKQAEIASITDIQAQQVWKHLRELQERKIVLWDGTKASVLTDWSPDPKRKVGVLPALPPESQS